MVDISAYEAANDPGGEGVDSNPYSVMAVNDGFMVVDAGGNDLLGVAADGSISTAAVFPARLVEFPPFSGNFMPMQAVPTSVTMGNDNNYMVGEPDRLPLPSRRRQRLQRYGRYQPCGLRRWFHQRRRCGAW